MHSAHYPSGRKFVPVHTIPQEVGAVCIMENQPSVKRKSALGTESLEMRCALNRVLLKCPGGGKFRLKLRL